jgi:hypothetical protein
MKEGGLGNLLLDSDSVSSTKNVLVVAGGLWDVSVRHLVNQLTTQLLEGTHHYSFLFKLFSPLSKQFNLFNIPGEKESKSLLAAHLVLNALNYSLCLDYKLSKSSMNGDYSLVHRERVRLLLLALLVLLCKRMNRIKLLALFSTPILPHVSLKVGSDWTIMTSQETIQESFLSFFDQDNLTFTYVCSTFLHLESEIFIERLCINSKRFFRCLQISAGIQLFINRRNIFQELTKKSVFTIKS